MASDVPRRGHRRRHLATAARFGGGGGPEDDVPRQGQPRSTPGSPATAAIVLATLVLALALSAAAVYQVLEEYRLLGTWLASLGR